MPPPPSYIDIDTNPFTRVVTQAEFNGGTFGGVANEVWFRFVATAHQALGLYTNNDNVFFPQLTVFKSDGSTVVIAQGTGFSAKLAARWANCQVADTPHYIRIRKNPVGASAFDFTFNSKYVPIDGFTIPADAVLVNDDSSVVQASAVFSRTGDHLGFLSVYPGGENGVALPDGTVLAHDRFGRYGSAGSIALISAPPTPAYVTSIDPTFSDPRVPCFSATQTNFYVLNRRDTLGTGLGPYNLFRVTPAGVVTLIAQIVSSQIPCAVGVNMGETIAYWCDDALNSNYIHRWDITNGVALSDLYTSPPLTAGLFARTLNFFPGDIVVLPDDTLVTWYQYGPLAGAGNAEDVVYVHLAPDGTLLHSKTVDGQTGGIGNSGQYPDHVCRIGSGSSQVKIWMQDDGTFFATGRWFTWNFNPDSESDEFRYDLYSEAVGNRAGVNGSAGQPGTSGSIGWPGPSASCFMLALLFGGNVPPPELPCTMPMPPDSGGGVAEP